MKTEQLEKSVAECLSLIDKKYNLNYLFDFRIPKAGFLTKKQYIERYAEIRSLKDFARPVPAAIYDPKLNYFYLIDSFFENDPNVAFLKLSICHEIYHSIYPRINKNLTAEHISGQLEKGGKSREGGEVLLSFVEGLCEFMSVETLSNIGDKELSDAAKKRDADFKEGISEWYKGEFLAQLSCTYSIKNAENSSEELNNMMKLINVCAKHLEKNFNLGDIFSAAKKLVLERNDAVLSLVNEEYILEPKKSTEKYFRNNEGALIYEANPYIFGYDYMLRRKEKNIVDIINDPPRTYRQLLCD